MDEPAAQESTGGTGLGHREVTLSRTGPGEFEVRNERGGTLRIGGTDDASFRPVELLLAAIAGCSAVDVDAITGRRALPDLFEVHAAGEKVRDEQGNHMDGLTVTFTARYPAGPDGDKARDMLPRAIQMSHDRLCTVSRTVQLGAPISMRPGLRERCRASVRHPERVPEIQIAQEPVADKVLSEHPFALLAGMLLDQQFPMERAFAGPAKILDRLGSVEPADVAAAEPERFRELCTQPPAIHRFPGSMAERVQALAAHVVEHYAGDTSRLWGEATSGTDLMKRLTALPGFGRQKAQIFVALLGKQLGVRPDGWQEAAGDYAEAGSFRSVADVVDAGSLQRVRDFKKAAKSKARQGPA